MEWLGNKLSGQSSWYTIAKAYIGIKLVIINTENHRSQKNSLSISHWKENFINNNKTTNLKMMMMMII